MINRDGNVRQLVEQIISTDSISAAESSQRIERG